MKIKCAICHTPIKTNTSQDNSEVIVYPCENCKEAAFQRGYNEGYDDAAESNAGNYYPY